MAQLQYMPGDPRLVDQLVYELKSKGIFDQFRKECIADVDTRPAYQNLRQRVENSVSTFLARQCWKPDLNKNQLREKLRKHILDGNYLEQGVERIVDQVVNPKVASVFIPQVEDLVYNYLGISRKKTVPVAETSNGKLSTDDLLPTDLEAVSPGSVKSNDDKDEVMETDIPEEVKMDVEEAKDIKENSLPAETTEKPKIEEETQLTTPIEVNNDSNPSIDKSSIPLPTEDIKLENIPAPENSPPKIELEKIELPKEPNVSKEIPLPDEIPLPKDDKEHYFKPIQINSDDDSSSDSSLRRNMSPLTPIRNYNNENSCDAQQGFDNDSDSKSDDKKEPSTFRFVIETKSADNSLEGKTEKKEEANLSYQFNNQVNINTFNTPMYDDSSNSNNLHIDYESDANSKNTEKVPETDHNSEDSKKEKKRGDKSSHKSSHKSRDSHRHSSSKDKRSDSKQSNSRDSSRHDKKSKDDHNNKTKSSHRQRERSKDKSDKKDSRDSSKHRSSHKSSSHRDSKSNRSSGSSQRHSSKHTDDKKSSSSHRDKERSSEKSSDKSSKDKDKKDSKSSSHRSDKDRKGSTSSSKSKHDDKDKKKDKKDTDDHYSLSGRGNNSRRSTDRDSNDGSSSSKGFNNQTSSKPSETKKESKGSSSKSDNTSTSGESTSPSDKEIIVNSASDTKTQPKPIRVENHLEIPIASPPRLPFVPDVTLKKPKFAANLEEAKKMMRMRKFLDEEQKRMNQEAALLLEFQANVRPSLSQVYSNIPGPELEFACISNEVNAGHVKQQIYSTDQTIEADNSNVEVNKPIIINNIVDEIKTQDEMNVEQIETANVIQEHNSELLNPDRNETYYENKPFSQLVDEISEYSKASERNKNNDSKFENLHDDENKKRTEYFEVTIITEELSESEDMETQKNDIEKVIESPENEPTVPENIAQDDVNKTESNPETSNSDELHYFAEHEKYEAELKRHQYSTFLKDFTDNNSISNNIYLFNCDTYEENIIREVATNFGSYEIINYYRNGHLTLPKTAKNVVNVNLASEITLPVDIPDNTEKCSTVFSPVKSECSFELSSDYDAKLEEMVNKTSRQQVMEIILGSVTDDKPTIDYCTESSIESDVCLKRKLEAESTVNNNRPVLIPKLRKLSESDQISSTTEETEEVSNNNKAPNSARSKYLGRARRVGLPRPRRANLANSPSSDKSVENYEQNTPVQPPNGKIKATPPRNKVQRYDTSDLYKPKLHYLSRRNNIT